MPDFCEPPVPRRSRGDPRGGTGGGTFDFTMPVFCLSGGIDDDDGPCMDDGAVVTIGLADVD